jgi:flagellar basal-body rod protein FlgC
MNLQNIFAVSASAMDVERLRVDVAALNLANARVPLSKANEGFRALQVVVTSAGQFSDQVDHWMTAPSAVLQPSTTPAKQVLEPGHPMADAQGLVSYPDVDHTREMLNMMTAMRAYEANVAAMNISRGMALKALEIGGNS